VSGKIESKRFFFEKKEVKKLLLTAGCGTFGATPQGPKVFCFFFPKKKRLLFPKLLPCEERWPAKSTPMRLKRLPGFYMTA
jgi:hypothetical protein